MADLHTGHVPEIAPFSQIVACIKFKHSGHLIFFVFFVLLFKVYQPPFALIVNLAQKFP